MFPAFFLFYFRYRKGLAFNGLKGFLTFLLTRELSLGGSKGGVTIDGSQHPVRFRLEMLDLFLPVDDEGEGRGLNTSDAEHLAILSVSEGIETCGIHA